MKTKVTHKYLGIVMQTGLAIPWIGDPHQDIVSVSIRGNIISWKSKKRIVVARSSAKAEYRSMAMVTCELMWVNKFLKS